MLAQSITSFKIRDVMLVSLAKAPAGKNIDLNKQNIRDQVYALVRERIHAGDIGGEHRLVDHEIAAQLNVSRMPVREALLQLKNEGYLDGTSRGFVLKRFAPEDIANMFEVRLLLEPAAATSACRNSTIEGLGRMTAAAQAAERAHRKADVLEYMQANWAFRVAWVGMVPNDHLAQIINRLRDHAQAVRLATLKDAAFRAKSLEHTKHILDAFVRRDLGAVGERIAQNLREAAASYYATQEALERGKSIEAPAAPRAKVGRRRNAA
ncbi:MAG: GntR family transcriptional regulator [Variovorax sp.]